MTDEPFQNFHFDGVIGLGLANLAVDSQFSFFEQMARSGENFVPQFGYFLSERDDVASEICFGGHDARHMRSSLQWTPVHDPHKGFWQVKILRVTVNGEEWSRAGHHRKPTTLLDTVREKICPQISRILLRS
jgi:hypothetical protein